MIELDKPVSVTISGVASANLVTVGSSPLPVGDNAVTPILRSVDISVIEACTVEILSVATVL